MDLRKVQEMGGGTNLVSLPKDWVNRNKVCKGTILSVEDDKNETLLISPFTDEKQNLRETVLSYPDEYVENLVNRITGAYLLGYDVIKIVGKQRMKFEERDKIKKSITQLVGLEILEEDAQTITAQFLLQSTAIYPEKILRRMHVISREMYKDALTALTENDEHLVKVAFDRDDEVDRLYFLLVRLVRSSMLDMKLANKFQLTPINCLDYRVAANLIESIGDAAVEISVNVMSIMKVGLNNEICKILGNASIVLEKIQDLAVNRFLTKNMKGGHEVITECKELSRKLQTIEDSFFNESPQIVRSVLGTIEAFHKVSRLSMDIADLTFPIYPINR